MTVESKTYRHFMPAQGGLDHAAVAAVLTHIGSGIATSGPTFKPFTAGEDAGYKAGAGSMTGADVAKLHGAVNGK